MRIPLSFTRKLFGLAPWCPNVGPDVPSLATPSSDKSTPSVRSLKFDCPVQPVVRLRSGFDRKQFISATSTLLKQAVRLELEQLFEHATNKP